MKIAKNIIIFLLINLVILGSTVIVPFYFLYEFSSANAWIIPENTKEEFQGHQVNKFIASAVKISESLDKEGKETFSEYLRLSDAKEKACYYKLRSMYIIAETLLLIAIIIIGIMTKYLSKKKVYWMSIVFSGTLSLAINIYIFHFFSLVIQHQA